MKSLRRHEGYYLLDHTQSPGNARAPEGTIFESETFTCPHRHCGGAVVIMRADRTRPRGYCPACDRRICDVCAAQQLTSGCTNLQRIFDELAEKAVQEEALEKLRIL